MPASLGTGFFSASSVFLVGPGVFREESVSSNPDSQLAEHWGDCNERESRYALYWGLFEQNAYRRVHSFGDVLKRTYGLYAYTRCVFNPSYRIVEFWATHLLGGPLDDEAGDGQVVPSSVPILTKSPRERDLRAALAVLWRDSNFLAAKETYGRFGAALGDVFLAVDDDPSRQQVTLRVVHPRTVKWVRLDRMGNVKGYTIEEYRDDPEDDPRPTGIPNKALFRETVVREGDAVVHRTYRNGEEYDWRDYPDGFRGPFVGPVWTNDYGFVPLVKVQHRDMGLGWGWSELHSALSKLYELDDLASKLDDQIRKLVESPYFFTGVAPPNSSDPNALTIAVPAASDDDPEPGRNRIPTFFAPNSAASVKDLVSDLNIASTSHHIEKLISEVERDHPELQADLQTASGDASGRALRVARERVEAMVVQRRAAYDDGLVRAHKMALSIGGMRGYPGYEAFDEGSFERGDLDHAIGSRPVFAIDTMDHYQELQAQATALNTYRAAGMPLEMTLKLVGLTPDEVAEVRTQLDAETARQLAAARTAQQYALGSAIVKGVGPAPPVRPGLPKVGIAIPPRNTQGDPVDVAAI